MRPVCVDQAELANWGNTSHIPLRRGCPAINPLMASICTKCLASQPLSELVPHTLKVQLTNSGCDDKKGECQLSVAFAGHLGTLLLSA